MSVAPVIPRLEALEDESLPEPPVTLVDIQAQDEKGNSALILAASEDRILLVQHILHLAGETGRLEQVLTLRNVDGLSALDMAIRRGAGRSAALIAEAASKERKRRRARLRRLSTSAVAFRRQGGREERYHRSDEPPTCRVKDIEESLKKRREEEEKIESIMKEEEQKAKQLDLVRQKTSSNSSLPVDYGSPLETRNFAQKAVSSLTEKLSNVLRSKKNRIETLPPVDPRRRDLLNNQTSSLDNTEPFTPDLAEEGEIETLGPDGLYPSEERAMAQSYRFPKILHRRRAASEHRATVKK